MTPANPSSLEREIATQNIAHIDAQNEELASPLRDFFTEYGYRVVINQELRVQADYHVAYGDSQYVKEIFAALPAGGTKRLAIIWDETGIVTEKLDVSGKIILVDPVPLSKETIQTIFRFFFTSSSERLDLRKNPKKHIPHVARQAGNPTPHVTKNWSEAKEFASVAISTTGDDEARINTIISSMFSPIKKQGHREKKRRASWTLRGLIVLCTVPFLWYFLTMAMTILSLGYAGLMLRTGHVGPAEAASHLAQRSVNESKRTLAFIIQPLGLVGATKYAEGQEHIVSFLADLSSSLGGVSKIFSAGKNVAGLLMSRVAGGKLISPAQEVETLRIELFSVQTNIGLAQSRLRLMLQEKTFPFWFPITRQIGERIGNALGKYTQSIGDVDRFLILYPYISGFRQKQTYLVLFQNSLELRPTGGFIGTIGILTAQDGTFSNIDIQDVYVVDGQLRGHVDPPRPIKELLGSEHWYLRDSNWDANFSVAASRAAWFYEKETGMHVDGVIGINTPMIVNLLSVTGPITMRDYNDRITSQNFYGKALFYTSSDFFPGSTQKQNFLGSFARSLLDELTNNKHISPISMFKVMTDGLAQHDLMFYFDDPELQRLVEGFGWSTRVFNRDGCAGLAQGSCIFHPLYVNEANLGINKVNYFIKRSLTRNISIGQDGLITEISTLSLQNSSRGKPQDSGGTYRTYIRFFFASDATVDRVDIDGAVVSSRNPKDTKPPVLPYFEYPPDETRSTKIIGIAVDILPGENKRISVTFDRNQKIGTVPGGAIVEVFTQKQPGVTDTPTNEFIHYPPEWTVSKMTEEQSALAKSFLAKDGGLEYNTILWRDNDIRILIEK